MPSIAAIILAAGGSSRLGRRKQLLHFQGQTLLRRAVESAVGAGCDPTVVVLGCEAEKMQPELLNLDGVQVVVNGGWERGIGSSIRDGMNRLLEYTIDAPAVLITLADQPLIAAGTLERQIAHFRASRRPVCASSYSETVGPPVIVSRLFFSKLLALPDAQGAKHIWVQNPDAVALFPCEEGGLDIDTPADLERLLAQADGRSTHDPLFDSGSSPSDFGPSSTH